MAEGTNGSAAPEAANDHTAPPEVLEPAQAGENGENGEEQASEEAMFTLIVNLPDDHDTELQILVSPHEQVHEVRQSIIEQPAALQFSCFHLEHDGERINDFVHLSDVNGLVAKPEVDLVEDPYTEKEARLHLIRVRELIGAAGDRTDTVQGILSGLSLFDNVAAQHNGTNGFFTVEEHDFQAPPKLATLLPPDSDAAPKTVKAISLSPWNPPPPPLRQKGHLLYIIVTTNEGEQYQITAHVGGFFVNKSSNSKFDPFPRAAPKNHTAHSLLTLIEQISPSFVTSFTKLQEFNNRKDPLAVFQFSNAIPAVPWIVPTSSSPSVLHSADITRTQEALLIGGVDNTDSLRDWNEEFQSARELPKDTVQDRVFRERLLSKLHADYNEAAARGAVLVARGEVAPLNPTEGKDAQIFVYNNVFFSFGADGVGTFTTEGGDEAARVATGKDVLGVKLVNQLDIDGLYTPGTAVIDYLGKRIVGQSIVPGIFKQPEPGENQIHYGAVDGKDVVANDEKFGPTFEKLSQAFKVKKHAVWDKEGKQFDLESSVETKGLLGTDGRKYVLDLYRVTPLDIAWLEAKDAENAAEYPHRMTVLRHELVDSLHKHKMREHVNAEIAKIKDKKASATDSATNGDESAGAEAAKPSEETKSTGESEESAEAKKESEAEKGDRIDVSNFKFALNPDVFSGQIPPNDEEKAQLAKDEQDVRDACGYLYDTVIPDLLKDLKSSDISFPMDGRALTRLLHRKGINMRYIGKLAQLSGDTPLHCLRTLCVREMISRSFKHVAARYLSHIPLPLASACISHLLNCLLGTGMNSKPVADIDPFLKEIYEDPDMAFQTATPETLRQAIEDETAKRYRYKLEPGWYNELTHLQLLREICLKLGIQLQSKDFVFASDADADKAVAEKPAANGNGENKKKKKKTRDGSPASIASTHAPHTFEADDIVNIVPIVKDSSPQSSLAEEALEAGRISLYQGQKKLGQELLLESLSLHEQIYGLLHPEVAAVYHTLSQLYISMDEKEAAVELARKAAIVSERTRGVDAADTVLDYLNLSLFVHQLGDTKAAVVYAKHALELWKLIYGADHPDSITTVNNVAVMLQGLKAFHESRRWFEESLRICEKVFGKQSPQTATLLFQLGQALALDHEPKAAVNRMRESYNIYLTELGPNDKSTKEAESWLEQLTQNAVSIAKQEKDVQARRLRAGIQFKPRNVSLGAAPATATGPAAGNVDKLNVPAIDSRNIDELIKFIEGGDKKQKGSAGSNAAKKRPGRGNPKGRGGSKTVSTSA